MIGRNEHHNEAPSIALHVHPLFTFSCMCRRILRFHRSVYIYIYLSLSPSLPLSFSLYLFRLFKNQKYTDHRSAWVAKDKHGAASRSCRVLEAQLRQNDYIFNVRVGEARYTRLKAFFSQVQLLHVFYIYIYYFHIDSKQRYEEKHL